jgi:phosphopantothenoylcysteine synthetase/decarboxylase
MIAANLVGDDRGFEKECNELLVLWSGGEKKLALASKDDIARQLIDLIVNCYIFKNKT